MGETVIRAAIADVGCNTIFKRRNEFVYALIENIYQQHVAITAPVIKKWVRNTDTTTTTA